MIASYDDQSIGKYQVATALGSAVGTIPFLPGGAKASLIALGAVAAPAAILGLGALALTGAGAVGAGYLGVKAIRAAGLEGVTNFAKNAAISAAETTRAVGGGAAYGVAKTASWVYNHPYATIGVAGAAGLGTGVMSSWMSPNRPHGAPYQESFTGIMGGTSNYGAGQIMSEMSADGSIVFGMNARR